MRFELRKYNMEKVEKVLRDVKGIDISINGTYLCGVIGISISEEVVYDGDPIPEEGYDGGKTEYIKLTFEFENGGTAAHSFCPNTHCCEIIFETDELWIIYIKEMKSFIESEIFDLQFRLKEYEEYTAI